MWLWRLKDNQYKALAQYLAPSTPQMVGMHIIFSCWKRRLAVCSLWVMVIIVTNHHPHCLQWILTLLVFTLLISFKLTTWSESIIFYCNSYNSAFASYAYGTVTRVFLIAKPSLWSIQPFFEIFPFGFGDTTYAIWVLLPFRFHLISDSSPLNVSFISFRILFSGSVFLIHSLLGTVIYSHSPNNSL